MKWFMHQSAAGRDAKIRKLKRKYGAEGLGLYWHCLEEICAQVDPVLTFELESDAELLAYELHIDTLKVEEMMRYMVELGLFEESQGVITCLKLARYLGDKNTRNPGLKAIIRDQKGLPDHDLSETVRDKPPTVRARGEERRGEEIREKRGGRKRPFPQDFEITPAMREWCEAKHPTLDIDQATSAWEDAMVAKGFKYVDWKRAWQSGMNKAAEWQAERQSKSGRAHTIEELQRAARELDER